MTKHTKYLPVFFLVFCYVLFAACTQERQPCLTPTTASLNIKTIRFRNGAAQPSDTALPAAVFRALTATGVKGFIFSRRSDFVISLSPVADTCTWAMTTDTTGTAYDTLTFYYKRLQQFISNACGYAYFYNLDSIRTTRHNIDSIQIINANVTNNVNTGNLQIYIHPGI
jgi:hypothetical protein